MTDKNDHPINWPVSIAIAAGALAFALMIWAASYSDGEKARAEVENNRNRIEYDKWLLEKGYIKEPRLR